MACYFKKRNLSGDWKEGRKRCEPEKLTCEASLMSTILITPDKGDANSIINSSLLFHERMSVL